MLTPISDTDMPGRLLKKKPDMFEYAACGGLYRVYGQAHPSVGLYSIRLLNRGQPL